MPDQSEGFLHQIVVMLPAFHAIEDRLDRETGHRFSVFDLFRTDEPAISRLLDALLNPKGTHGQGDLFLQLFIKRFIPEWHDKFSYGRAKPSATSERIDVTISDNQHWLGIENKVFYAQEQQRQTDRYLIALKNSSDGSQNGDYRLVYLSPKGEQPNEYSLTKGGRQQHQAHFVIGAWVPADDAAQGQAEVSDPANFVRTKNVLDWLSDCERECRADNVRWFLRQLWALVRKKLVHEEEFVMTGNAIIDLALRSTENLDAALRIGAQDQKIRDNVTSAVLAKIRHQLQQWVQRISGDWELNSV